MEDISTAKIKDLFPNIEIKNRIGKGGQKKVYEGIHNQYGKIALKIICPSNKAEKERALREISVASKLNAHFFAKLYDYNEIELENKKVIYVVEEFIPGMQLGEKLIKIKPNRLKKQEVKFIIESILRALVITEEKHLVHRDIKPTNIIINVDRIVLIDFGIVRHLDENSLTATYARHGPMTIGYAAPEQINNEKRKISIRTDLFSVGVLFYELLTGENPFIKGTSSWEEILNNTLKVTPEPLVNQGFDESFDYFVEACLQKHPHRRLPSAEKALKLLKKINWEA